LVEQRTKKRHLKRVKERKKEGGKKKRLLKRRKKKEETRLKKKVPNTISRRDQQIEG